MRLIATLASGDRIRRLPVRVVALGTAMAVVLLLGGGWLAGVGPWHGSSTSSLTTLTPTDAPAAAAPAVPTQSTSNPPSAKPSQRTPARATAEAPAKAPAKGSSDGSSSGKTASAGSENPDTKDPDDEAPGDNIEGAGDGTNPIPMKFRGFWEGAFDLSSGASTTITAQSDDVAGNIVVTLPKLGCSGFMDFEHATADTLELDARITYDADDKCDQFGHGVVTWSLQSKNALVMVWQEAAHPEQTVFNVDLKKS